MKNRPHILSISYPSKQTMDHGIYIYMYLSLSLSHTNLKYMIYHNDILFGYIHLYYHYNGWWYILDISYLMAWPQSRLCTPRGLRISHHRLAAYGRRWASSAEPVFDVLICWGMSHPQQNGRNDGFLIGVLEHEFDDFPYIGKNHPNWRTPSFFREVGIPPTSFGWFGGFMNGIHVLKNYRLGLGGTLRSLAPSNRWKLLFDFEAQIKTWWLLPY